MYKQHNILCTAPNRRNMSLITLIVGLLIGIAFCNVDKLRKSTLVKRVKFSIEKDKVVSMLGNEYGDAHLEYAVIVGMTQRNELIVLRTNDLTDAKEVSKVIEDHLSHTRAVHPEWVLSYMTLNNFNQYRKDKSLALIDRVSYIPI
jgi:hypothetical protein